ncbi:unnamed protein product [Amaranthus hypochondriacus]
MKTQYLCFPLTIKPTTTATTTETPSTSTTNDGRVAPLPSSSLLNRFRVAVFRLIMVTTLSKVTNNNRSSSPRSSSFTSHNVYHKRSTSSSNNNHESIRRPSSCYLYDPYHTEALADCIEFIKKKSASSSPSDRFYHHDDDQIARDSTVSHDLVIPLPIM